MANQSTDRGTRIERACRQMVGRVGDLRVLEKWKDYWAVVQRGGTCLRSRKAQVDTRKKALEGGVLACAGGLWGPDVVIRPLRVEREMEARVEPTLVRRIGMHKTDIKIDILACFIFLYQVFIFFY